jgi:hypothetical protein
MTVSTYTAPGAIGGYSGELPKLEHLRLFGFVKGTIPTEVYVYFAVMRRERFDRRYFCLCALLGLLISVACGMRVSYRFLILVLNDHMPHDYFPFLIW